MSAATYFIIASGFASVTLTVWGRLLPPDSRRTKWGFMAVGACGVVCLGTAGILNAASQERMTTTITTMAKNVAKLAGPADADPKLSSDQILAAAAAKLISQQSQIDRLEKQQREDHSTKRLIRDLLTRVDSRIPAAIDAGHGRLEFLMHPQDFDSLKILAERPDATSLIKIVRGDSFVSTSSINCGSADGLCPGPQVRVVIEMGPDMKP